jgi:MYXO-CTERM domain-containing protein
MLFGRALADAEVAGLDAALRIANPPKVTLVGAPPGAPTIGAATAVGTTGHVTFGAPSDTGAGPITRYQATCSPDGDATAATGPIDVTGLTPAQPHKCRVRAYNAYGAGPWSADSNEFVPGGAPSFSSAAAATFTVLANGAFTIVAAGQPAPTVDVAGTLPPGLTVVDGILEGTPASGSVGTYALTLTASNGILPNATQNLSLEVKKAAQTISFATLDNQVLGAQKVQVNATSSATLPIALASTTTPVCTISSAGAISLHAVGVCTITAAQAGNIDYEPAPTVTKSFQIELRPPNDADASTSTPDASTSSKPDSSAIYPPDASSASNGLGPDSIRGGGCQCDATGGSAPVGGLLFAGLGLLLGRARRLRRSK